MISKAAESPTLLSSLSWQCSVWEASATFQMWRAPTNVRRLESGWTWGCHCGLSKLQVRSGFDSERLLLMESVSTSLRFTAKPEFLGTVWAALKTSGHGQWSADTFNSCLDVDSQQDWLFHRGPYLGVQGLWRLAQSKFSLVQGQLAMHKS